MGNSIPNNLTCANCVHIDKCLRMGFSWAERKECDFGPSRFRINKETLPGGNISEARPLPGRKRNPGPPGSKSLITRSALTGSRKGE